MWIKQYNEIKNPGLVLATQHAEGDQQTLIRQTGMY